MRIGCSKLRGDLCRNLHVIEHPGCDCGHPLENARHFFLHCPLYQDQREQMFDSVSLIMQPNLQNLLFGNRRYSLEQNKLVFSAVQSYIKQTSRFA